jgi:hypothetical protein
MHTVRCAGPAVFRNQLARDVACLLDVDDDVQSWSCLSRSFTNGTEAFRPDFVVESAHSEVIVDVSAKDERPSWLENAVASSGARLQLLTRADLPAVRLRNAKDLLRYARYEASLDDRVRLLAALDEGGSLTVAECMAAFRSDAPIPSLASLILNRFVAVDLDEAPIGPETIVRRRRG